jgi:hypothetical protein
MAERPSLPTLLVESVGENLTDMLASATRDAKEFFGDIPFRCMSFDARERSRVEPFGGGDGYLAYEANVLFMATGVLPAGAATPDAEPDDDEEVRIRPENPGGGGRDR